MKANMTYNESVKTFDNIACHLELEDKRLKAIKSNLEANVVVFSLHKASWPKRKRVRVAPKEQGETAPKKFKSTKHKKGKCGGKKNLNNVKSITIKRWDTLLAIALRQKRYLCT